VADAVIATFWDANHCDPETGRIAEVQNQTRLIVDLTNGEPVITQPSAAGELDDNEIRGPYVVIPINRIVADTCFALSELHRADAA
jgi:hypothetical protein